jgi:hypothetical protein
LDLSLQPSFQFWIKRTDDVSAPFCLRFEVRNGKGLLRVAHPDVLLDPPASDKGVQEALSAEVVRASRFLLVGRGGRDRKGFFLAGLGATFLDRLPLDLWVELTPRVAGDMRLLVPPPRLPEGVVSDPDMIDPNEDDLVTNPGDAGSSQRERIRDVLASYETRGPTKPAGATPVVKERSWGDGDVSLFDFHDEHTDPSIDGDTIFIGGTEDEARALVGGALLASASMFDAPPAPSLDPVDDTDPPDPQSAMATLTDEEDLEPGISGESMPRIALTQLPIGAPRTALVRHLRRSAQRDHQRLERLESRVAELEALLHDARRKLSERD